MTLREESDSGTVYLAARYSRRVEIATYGERLAQDGWEITSRWLLGNHQAENDDLFPGSAAEQFAREDLEDLDRAEWFVIFPEQPREPTTMRGGAHVEYGYALARGKRIIIVGPRANVFHCLAEVDRVATFEEARLMMAGQLAADEGVFV